MDKSPVRPAAGLSAGFAALVSNGLGLLLSRLELAALELAEVRNQLLRLVVVLGLALMAIWFTIAYGSVLLMYLAWERLGWKILPIITLLFAGIAVGLLHYARNMVNQGCFSLPATMGELRADRDSLL
ncbi:phage holin family protein [Chitinimonas naiadis]